MSTDKDIDELAQRFDTDDYIDPDEIPDAIREAMQYIDDNSGLLGDYHDGEVTLAASDGPILWYGRGRLLAGHTNLEEFVQDHPNLYFKNMGYKDLGDGPESYAEIHLKSRWAKDHPISPNSPAATLHVPTAADADRVAQEFRDLRDEHTHLAGEDETLWSELLAQINAQAEHDE